MVTEKSGDMDASISPEHYKFEGGIEAIDYILAICRDLPGNEAALVTNVLKYISRYQRKGYPQRDLKKAEWYLHRLQSEVDKKYEKDKTDEEEKR